MYPETTRICGSMAPHIEGIPMVNPYTGMPDLDLLDQDLDLSPFRWRAMGRWEPPEIQT